MNIAIVGSRDFPDWGMVTDYVDRLPKSWTIVSGAARGVDSVAAKAARLRGMAVKEFPAEWERLGRGAGEIRNTDIINAADLVVAFWDGKSTGTKDSIDKAKVQNKPLIIFGPHGAKSVINRDKWNPTT